ncbi:EamA family transporter [Quadrisphaera sp. DSM 44207]|uniref:EamA family transporter n=1 Tax=Quadrisphaera sp. DSM 44207 TaxID=1881057 RepID=UPI000883DA61|nr:EamA family transporter [Quadrisphaera sp. DSM 44207]SDQ87371.1 Threonine/homoserine efflux transporter RhtA [Quadrisphaera sp. DSM 44207]
MLAPRGAGLGLALVSAAAFGTSGALAAVLLDAGWSAGAAVTARVALAALVLTPLALLQLRGRRAAPRRGARAVVVYGLVAVAGCQLCYFNAVARVPVGVALLLEYSGALLVVAWLWVRHGQRPRRLTLGGALLAVVGLILVLDLSGDARLDPVGVLWGLGAAVGLAVYFVLAAAAEDPLPPLVLVWGGLGTGALALLAAAATGALAVRAPLTDVVLLGARVSWLVPVLALALVAAALAYVAGVRAARSLGARLAAFVGLTEVLFAVLFAWLLLGQVPASVQLLGGALVLAGVALVRLDELRRREPAPLPGAPEAAPTR